MFRVARVINEEVGMFGQRLHSFVEIRGGFGGRELWEIYRDKIVDHDHDFSRTVAPKFRP